MIRRLRIRLGTALRVARGRVMRILFIAAKLHTNEPFGVMCLSPMLKRDGHAVALMEAETPDLAARVRAFRPDVVG